MTEGIIAPHKQASGGHAVRPLGAGAFAPDFNCQIQLAENSAISLTMAIGGRFPEFSLGIDPHIKCLDGSPVNLQHAQDWLTQTIAEIRTLVPGSGVQAGGNYPRIIIPIRLVVRSSRHGITPKIIKVFARHESDIAPITLRIRGEDSISTRNSSANPATVQFLPIKEADATNNPNAVKQSESFVQKLKSLVEMTSWGCGSTFQMFPNS
jgi:hypothetical protein